MTSILEELNKHSGVGLSARWDGSPDPSDPRNIRRLCSCGAVIGQLLYPRNGTYRLGGDPFDRPHREHIAEVLDEKFGRPAEGLRAEEVTKDGV